jgi:hypothetical protein
MKRSALHLSDTGEGRRQVLFENDEEILGPIKCGKLLASHERLLFVELFYYLRRYLRFLVTKHILKFISKTSSYSKVARTLSVAANMVNT